MELRKIKSITRSSVGKGVWTFWTSFPRHLEWKLIFPTLYNHSPVCVCRDRLPCSRSWCLGRCFWLNSQTRICWNMLSHQIHRLAAPTHWSRKNNCDYIRPRAANDSSVFTIMEKAFSWLKAPTWLWKPMDRLQLYSESLDCSNPG